jgi:uridine kinase
MQGIFTILRSAETTKQDFVFFVDRLATLLMETAVNLLPHVARTVTTPTGAKSHGLAVGASCVCGVSILRSGGALERGFRRVMNNVPVGSLLVQTDTKTSEPLLLHVKLPLCVRERHKAERSWVFLLDAQVGTGASAFMAIRVLLDHGVKQEHIIFVTMLMAASHGISVLRKAFPLVSYVCGAVDKSIEEREVDGRTVWVMSPGMGMIGDRYYL